MTTFIPNIERLEFLVTHRCNARCAHCYVPKIRHQPHCINGKNAANIVEKIANHYQLKSVMAFGGEPLLCLESVLQIVTAAKENHIPARELITNGFWHKNENSTRLIAEKLKFAGVNWIG